MQDIATMICLVVIKEQGNVTLSRIGFWCMKSVMRCLCSCYIVSERILNCLRNDWEMFHTEDQMQFLDNWIKNKLDS